MMDALKTHSKITRRPPATNITIKDINTLSKD